MVFDYQTNIDSVINALKDYNTTTASPDLSNGLNVRVDNDDILIGDQSIVQTRADRLPTIFVEVETKDEEYSGIGATGPAGHQKFANVVYNVYAIVGKYGAYMADSDLLSDVYALAGNLESVFQAEYDLSGTAMWCNPESTIFKTGENIGDGFAKIILVKLRARYMFR